MLCPRGLKGQLTTKSQTQICAVESSRLLQCELFSSGDFSLNRDARSLSNTVKPNGTLLTVLNGAKKIVIL